VSGGQKKNNFMQCLAEGEKITINATAVPDDFCCCLNICYFKLAFVCLQITMKGYCCAGQMTDCNTVE